MPEPLFCRCPGILATTLPDGEVAIVDASTRTVFSLNETGAWLWEQLGTPQSSLGLGRALAQHYAIDEAQACADAADVLDELRREGLIVPA